MPPIRLIAPAQYAAPLSLALQDCGVRADSNARNARAVVVSSFAPADVAAAADSLASLDDDAIVAAQTPPHFPFPDALSSRAKTKWKRPFLTIPPLRSPADFAAAARKIADAMTKTGIANSADPAMSPADAAARARRDLDDVL